MINFSLSIRSPPFVSNTDKKENEITVENEVKDLQTEQANPGVDSVFEVGEDQNQGTKLFLLRLLPFKTKQIDKSQQN